MVAEIEDFRRQAKRCFTCFDPGDLEEKPLCRLAIEAAEQGHRTVEYGPPGQKAAMETSQLLDISPTSTGRFTPATSSSSTRRT